MRKLILIAAVILLFGAALGQQTNNTVEWERIGLKKVGHKVKTVRFSVDKNKQYRFIKLRIFKTSIIIEKWVLEYRNGITQHVGFVGLASENRSFPAIPVHGRLKKIHLTCYSADKDRKAEVELLGSQ